MDKKKFRLWNTVVSVVILIIAAFTYISTIEPTASFWDCGEFIASSFKLEVGHPPGNPVFQLFARFFTIFAGAKYAAIAVNIMSALCSAFTIMLLYLTIVFFLKRLVKSNEDGTYSKAKSIAIFSSAAVGALCYCFSDTFWFSAVEGEVYAMSSLFTALVVWLMTKWYEQADKPYANRWIILICFLMGLSIGVHLLNLLTIPVLVFLYFYRKRENAKYNIKEFIGIGLLSCVILALVLFFIIPSLPKIAGYFDLFFVNVLSLPFNSGAIFFAVALLVACFFGIYITYKKSAVLLNNILLAFTMIVIGFSCFSIVIIRSNAKTPTNEYQPDNPFTLVRYLDREQYGSAPLLYGQYFDAPSDVITKNYWTPLGNKYISTPAPAEPVYSDAGKMFFPRMWNGNQQSYVKFYLSYYKPGSGSYVDGAKYRKPDFMTNMRFFFDYQLNWMYWRYFMWNFVGRQNDIHSPMPGNPFFGNWESGVKFIDNMRLGDQSKAPFPLRDNKAKNHFFFLPLLLGLIGLMFQFEKDKRGFWLTFLFFFMTGIAIVIFLNQSPLQVRERDYAYAGSFYAFAIWIGVAVLAIYEIFEKYVKEKHRVAFISILAILGLSVPSLMAEQNWDDHDRSHRKTTIEMASNYLNSVGKDGILITHGDNDTFPLWYAQEVEDVRPDVRICNTSLLGTDWHIDQMKYACNKSAALPLTVPKKQYLYGTNDYVIINDTRDTVIPIKDVMTVFKSPNAKVALTSGKEVNYIMSRKISVPVNKENVIKYGILPASYKDQIPDSIVLVIPKNVQALGKPDLFMLDLLSNYKWDRPINILGGGGDINMGLKDYLMYEGFSWKFIPIKNEGSSTMSAVGKIVDVDGLYNKMRNVYKWDNLSRSDYCVDYENLFTFLGVVSQRDIFYNTALIEYEHSHLDRAKTLLKEVVKIMPEKYYPYSSICLGFYNNDIVVLSLIDLMQRVGLNDEAYQICKKMLAELITSINFYSDPQFIDAGSHECIQSYRALSMLNDLMSEPKYKDLSKQAEATIDAINKRFDLQD